MPISAPDDAVFGDMFRGICGLLVLGGLALNTAIDRRDSCFVVLFSYQSSPLRSGMALGFCGRGSRKERGETTNMNTENVMPQ